MEIKEISASSYVSKSKLPDADYVINPYVGCPHKCIYCYAEYMKRFSGHSRDEWGDFVDVKICDKDVNASLYSENETILFGSVTDAYNPFEKKYEKTRRILEQLVSCKARIEILTKSDLILRDIDILKKIPNVYVGISMNTTDDAFRKEIEPFASSIEMRINTLDTLHKEGIPTYLFMSPIFPGLSDCKEVIDKTHRFINYVCFENLNLRGAYLPRVMDYIKESYSEYQDMYKSIYWNKSITYWENLKIELEKYCKELGVEYRFYFYHEKIKKK